MPEDEEPTRRQELERPEWDGPPAAGRARDDVPPTRRQDPPVEREDPPTRRQDPPAERTAQPTVQGTAAGAARHAAHGVSRLVAAWRALSGEYRLAAVASVGLFFTMFLPWYEQTTTVVVRGNPVPQDTSLSAFQAFSWVEAAVLVVAVSILLLCFTRGEKKSYHLPGGDGTVVLAGGVWVCVLVFIRQLDKPLPDLSGAVSASVGVQWGIFITFLFGLLLAYAGWRLRIAHRPEPGPLDEAVAAGDAPARGRSQARTADEPDDDTRVMRPDEEPTRHAATPASSPAASTPAARERPRARPARAAPEPDDTTGEQLRFEE